MFRLTFNQYIFCSIIFVMLLTASLSNVNAPVETYIKRAKAYEKISETEKAEVERKKYIELSQNL